MSNAKLKGPRYLEKMLPEAKQRSNGSRTPFNSIRITALLKVLRASKLGVELFNIKDEDVVDDYNCLKAFARRIRQNLFLKQPELRGISWSKLGQEHPSIQKTLSLELENRAYENGIYIHNCVEMWGADRLLSESFRGAGKAKKAPQASAYSYNSGSEDSW